MNSYNYRTGNPLSNSQRRGRYDGLIDNQWISKEKVQANILDEPRHTRYLVTNVNDDYNNNRLATKQTSYLISDPNLRSQSNNQKIAANITSSKLLRMQGFLSSSIPNSHTSSIERLFYNHDYKHSMKNPSYSMTKNSYYDNTLPKINNAEVNLNLTKPITMTFDIHNLLSRYQKPFMNLSPAYVHKPPLNNNELKEDSKVNNLTISSKYEVSKSSFNERDYLMKNPWSVKQYSFKQYHNIKYKTTIEEYSLDIDRFDFKEDQGLFCFFKGYGGSEVAEYAKNHFANIFRSLLKTNPFNIFPHRKDEKRPDKKVKGVQSSTEMVLLNTFKTIDDDIKYMNCDTVGATACVVYLTKEVEQISGYNQPKRMIYCANIGNSQCLIVNQINTKKLTTDHSLNYQSEKKRIIQSGGIIYDGKIYGQIDITKAFGYYALKIYGLNSVPDIIKYSLSDRDKYMIIGSNGVFDVLSEREIFFFCNSSESTEDIADNIIKNALLRGTKDNISVYVIKL